MTVGESYKYLGIKQATAMDHGKVKEQITKQFQKRIDAILKTELNGKNTTKAINIFAITVLTYSFGIIKWSETDLNNLQNNTN
jgi:glucuronate isomerase